MINETAWTPPAAGYLKLNVDGSWKALQEAGGGGVFRGVNGNWYMAFASKFSAITPLAAELYTIREGLMMAVDYDIKHLELETDAKTLVTLLNTVDHTYHHELSPVIKDVVCLMNRFPSLEIKHTSRTNNQVAHNLAEYSTSMAVGYKLFLSPPPFVEQVFQADLRCVQNQEGQNVSSLQAQERQVIDLEAPPPPRGFST